MFETLTQRLGSVFGSLRGKKELTEENIEEGLRSVRQALLEADVNFQVAREFTERVRQRVLGDELVKGVDPSEQFVHGFHAELVELMGPEDARLDLGGSGPAVILLAGLQGAGKTTTCAKLAKLLRERHQRRPLMVAADIKRPAAVEQLKVLGQKIGVPVFHEEGLSAPEVCARGLEEARRSGADVVLLDTAGRLHVDDELMAEVAEIAQRTQPRNQVLVVDAMTGQDAVRSAAAFHERLSLTGVILTKLDGDARGGAAVSLKATTGRPVLFIGTGEKIDDIDAFAAERMAGRILGMGDVVGLVEKAQQSIDEEEAQRSVEKMVMGTFTLEDMLAQFRMIQKLGPLKKVMGMMPGLSGMVDQLDVDDNHMKRMEALFLSMTPRERLGIDDLDMSRRRRVAAGAGQDVSAINELLKAHKGMKRMMKEMNKMGLGAKLGAKGKKAALRDMSPDGELLGGGGGGLFGGLGGGGGLGGLFGGGGGGGMPDPSALAEAGLGGMGGAGRPRGSSATRKSGAKKKRQKPKKNQRRKKR